MLCISSCSVSLDNVDLTENLNTTSVTQVLITEKFSETVPEETSAAITSSEAVSTTTTTFPETAELPAVTRSKVISELTSVYVENSITVNIPITWIGDSYSVENISLLRERFSDLDFGKENPGNDISPYAYIQFGRHMDWISYPDTPQSSAGGLSGTDILDSITDLRPCVVFALGTNDAAVTGKQMTETLDHIADKVGKDTIVVLTTAYIQGGGNFDEANDAKRKYAEEHPNFYTTDWAAIATDDYYIQSSVHPYDNGGYSAWADLLYCTLLQIEKERQ